MNLVVCKSEKLLNARLRDSFGAKSPHSALTRVIECQESATATGLHQSSSDMSIDTASLICLKQCWCFFLIRQLK